MQTDTNIHAKEVDMHSCVHIYIALKDGAGIGAAIPSRNLRANSCISSANSCKHAVSGYLYYTNSTSYQLCFCPSLDQGSLKPEAVLCETCFAV